ncbi:FHA domain-containing protein [Curtobacterium oceanosedimentum]|nr:FHA domain-containing protein [Curtobacterium oceanosedimentum]MCA5923058.1 FHA domain-containing protein [Curtobacterium oceanosedimentum]
MLPDGAIFCGECGRAVTAAASRRPVAPTPVEQAPPPPLQQPDSHGRRSDPAADAWLPESTLDPATRAWLTGADRRGTGSPAVPVERPDAFAPREAPSHVHGAGSGLTDAAWSPARGEQEPPLDPNAYPSEAAGAPAEDDPERTRLAPGNGAPSVPATGAGDASQPDDQTSSEPKYTEPTYTAPTSTAPTHAEPAAPVWAPPAATAPPTATAGPSWWVGRSTASAQAPADPVVPPMPAAPDDDGASDNPGLSGTGDEPDAEQGIDAGQQGDQAHDAVAGDPGSPAVEHPPVVSPPQPGDTAVVEPLVDRRPQRPSPLVTPGMHATTICHVCGNQLEPDDIFCGECGAVRPAVTAAFTGPVVPLPMLRPDWAANDSVDVAASDDAEAPDGSGASDDATASDSTAASDGTEGTAGTAGTTAGTTDSPGSTDADAAADTDGRADAHGLRAADLPTDVEGTTGSVASSWSQAPTSTGRRARTATPDAQDDRDGTSTESSSAPTADGTDPSAQQDADERWPIGSPDDAAQSDRPRGAHAAPLSGSEAPSRWSPFAGSPIPPVPGSANAPTSAPAATATPAPTAAPLPPIPGATNPALSLPPQDRPALDDRAAPDDRPAPVAGSDELDEDVDETRIVAKTPTHAPFVLHFSTGERFGVHGTGLLGRLPRPQPGERFDDLLTVHDPGKSVSKTHLELGRDGEDLWVSDRFSGNGTVVRHVDGSIRRCEPGRRYRVERGARVDIGEQFFLVQ